MEEKIKAFLKTIKLNESMLSMIFGVLTVVLVGILLFRAYKANPVITDNAESTKTESTEKIGEVTVETKEDGKKYPTTLPETYKVEKGDNLWKIAQKYYGSGYNWVDIAKENNLGKNAGLIEVGQELKIPKTAVKEIAKAGAGVNTIESDTYTVVKGDNLWTISVRAYGDGYKWTEIAKTNKLLNPNIIEVGQNLKLPR